MPSKGWFVICDRSGLCLNFGTIYILLLSGVEESLVEFLKEKYDKACLIHNLGLKINITGRRDGCKRMVAMIGEILEREEYFLPSCSPII